MSWAGFSRRLFGARECPRASRPSRANRSSSGNPSRANERTSSRLSAITLSSCSLALARWSQLLCMPARGLHVPPAASIKAWVLRAEAARFRCGAAPARPPGHSDRARSAAACCSPSRGCPSVLETACRVGVAQQTGRPLHHINRPRPPAPANSPGSTSKRDGPERITGNFRARHRRRQDFVAGSLEQVDVQAAR